jgi:hypothetical protein
VIGECLSGHRLAVQGHSASGYTTERTEGEGLLERPSKISNLSNRKNGIVPSKVLKKGSDIVRVLIHNKRRPKSRGLSDHRKTMRKLTFISVVLPAPLGPAQKINVRTMCEKKGWISGYNTNP